MTGPIEVVINPGSGPVAESTYAQALQNMAVFVAEAGCHSLTELLKPDQGDGRFKFFVCRGSTWHEVDMPGIPLAKVRWMGEPDQDIWDFPRLYVDGSSWVWKFAVNAAGGER